jgi:hypothetical protein
LFPDLNVRPGDVVSSILRAARQAGADMIEIMTRFAQSSRYRHDRHQSTTIRIPLSLHSANSNTHIARTCR